ncbi:hypothetical protein DPMN_109721 [Dreissena polymorpha]|uniref:Uncharacterized protein n=1 Tax=Dreissena polymorpha TaxID=45954 RepID=A0A9D4KBP0_DREPO|nr:hypothetical protein DPMN_109721 [Dreissena polymorpha]
MHPDHALGVSSPPSLPSDFGVPCKRLHCRIECRLAKGVAYSQPTSLKMSSSTGCCFVLLHNSSLNILDVFLMQLLIKTCIFFMVVTVRVFPGLCFKEEYWLYDGIDESNLGRDAYCAGSPDVVQLMEGCSYFTDAGSDTYTLSFLVVQMSRMLPR